MALRIFELTPQTRRTWESGIAGLEQGISYPLGQDRFTIDHGLDYFAFFDRMGPASTYVATVDQKVAAVGSLVSRRIPPSPGRTPVDTWYLCDLKVNRPHRRKRIPIRMFSAGFRSKYTICPRGYAISMNPSDGSENPIVRLARHITLAPVSTGPTLLFYSLSCADMIRIRPFVEEHLGPIGFLSLKGVKDIVLQSTGLPMPLLHLQHGPCAVDGLHDPQDEHVHMFCTPMTDPLAEVMLQQGVAATATASILHHRMKNWDWRFVLSSEI